jgi:putative redox protein
MAKITTYHKGDMLFGTRLGSHEVLVDVPPSMGGKDRGPTPPEFFVASLGSCVAALVANYCSQSGIDTTDMSIDVTFDKVDDPTRLVNLKVQIDLPHADVTGREKALLRVAERCPVHETVCHLDNVEMSLNGHSK